MSDLNIGVKSFYFTPQTILPTQSFTGRFLYAVASSNLLNPPAFTVKTSIDEWVWKPLRGVCRIVSLVFAALILAPAGIVTHISASACYSFLSLVGRIKKDAYTTEKYQSYAWEHLKSAGLDCLSTLGIITPSFVDEPHTAVHMWMSGTSVKVEKNNVIEFMRFDDYIQKKLFFREYIRSETNKEIAVFCR